MSDDGSDGPSLDEAAAEIGSVFGGDFRVLRELRAGGMGQLYTVERLSTGGTFVLKLLPPDLVRHRPARERFAREAKAMAQLSNEHSVEVIASGVDEPTGTPFIVMELLEGEDLADAIDRCGALPIVDVMQILDEVAVALEEAHAQGIVHRDLKPENIFLVQRPDGGFSTKLLDFGVAKFISAADAVVGTQPVGSPLFMAPEQADSLGPITPATDVWAFGLLAFLLLTGRHFWLGAENGSAPGLLRESILDPLVPASERAARFDVNVALPSRFDDWFARCVNRDPTRRFQSVGEAVVALDGLVADLVSAGEVVEDPDALPTDRPLALTESEPEEAEPITSVRPTLASSALAAAPSVPPAPDPTAELPRPPSRPARRTPSGVELPEAPREARATPTALRQWGWFLPAAAVFLAIGAGITAAKISLGGEARAPAATAAEEVVASASPSARANVSSPTDGCPEGAILVAPPPGSEAPFCMDRAECTVARFERVSTKVRASSALRAPSPFDALCNGGRAGATEPANCLSVDEAAQACALFGGRLPTVAEWRAAERVDAAARTGGRGANTCGAECADWGVLHKAFVDAFASARDAFPGTAPVGSFATSSAAEALADLDGNVAEWTRDKLDGEAFVCGASFLSGPRSTTEPSCRPAGPRMARASVGFRCVYAHAPASTAHPEAR